MWGQNTKSHRQGLDVFLPRLQTQCASLDILIGEDNDYILTCFPSVLMHLTSKLSHLKLLNNISYPFYPSQLLGFGGFQMSLEIKMLVPDFTGFLFLLLNLPYWIFNNAIMLGVVQWKFNESHIFLNTCTIVLMHIWCGWQWPQYILYSISHPYANSLIKNVYQ